MSEGDQENLVCPHCIQPITSLDHFCPHCGGLVSSRGAIDPMGQIYATGQAYRNAAKSPKRIVLIGIWLLFAPQLVLLLIGLFVNATYLAGVGSYGAVAISPVSQGSPNIFNFLFMMMMAAIYLVLLIKVTLGYCRARKQTDDDDPNPAEPHGFPVLPPEASSKSE